ncbi:hypothetical protein HZA97_08235 [Candidatus Woesearchaeota archaeon]|nr:hypothetical protein [Candidatus Woesearchaeota archaeon]
MKNNQSIFSEEYKQLNTQLKYLLMSKNKYTLEERIKHKFYQISRNTKKTKELRQIATQRKFEHLTDLLEKMYLLVKEQYEITRVCKEQSCRLQLENITQLNYLESGQANNPKSTKKAINTLRLNDRTIDLLIETYEELEIKYKTVLEFMFPALLIQGKIAIFHAEATQLKEDLIKMTETSQELIKANTDLTKSLAQQNKYLSRKQIPDINEEKAEELLSEVREELKTQKSKWKGGVQKSLSGYDCIRNNYARYEFFVKAGTFAASLFKDVF